jgi:hypothetical protein
VDDEPTGWLARVKANLPLLLGLTVAAGTMFLLVYPICQDFNDRKLRIEIQAHLKDLAQAVHAYHDEHRTFPPHATYDKEGKPLLSWRVLVLPYLGEQELYQQFKLDEPWDSPHNQKLLDRMPPIYLHPAAPSGTPPFATYWQVFVGPGAAFEGSRGLQRSEKDFPDGTSNTILIAEASRPVPWTKPEDLPYAPGQSLPALGGHTRSGGFYVALADGATHWVWSEASEATLRGAITRNGKDELGSDW